jgi:hypothetical protein
MEDDLLAGAYDLHVHAGPDVRPRRLAATELLARAAEAGMAGLVLKSHHSSTALQATALQDRFPELIVAGSIVLNEPVGGINPAAVDAALRLGARVVWLPTLDSLHERRFRGRPGGLTVFGQNGGLTRETRDVLQLVAEHLAVLATGHLGPVEVTAVVRAAQELGIPHIVITHPEIAFLDLSVEFQSGLRGPGVLFERSYPRPNFACGWDGLASRIRSVGVESSVIGTDLGQAESIDPVNGLAAMLAQLASQGFSREEIRHMACEVPARLLARN